jgi:hypothetical protein
MAAFTWDVHLPGEDLPRPLETDHLLSEGDEVFVDGQAWVVDSVEVIDEAAAPKSGVVTVAASHDPGLPSSIP